MSKNNHNGLAKWVAIIIVLAKIVYSIIDTRAILQNDVKHIQDDILEVKLDIRELRLFLIDKEK